MDRAELKTELEQLRQQISKEEKAAAAARSKADKLHEGMRQSGVDPLSDADAFEQVDAAYRAADEHRDQAAQLRSRLLRVMDWLGESAEAPQPQAAQSKPEGQSRSNGSPIVDLRSMGRRYVESEVGQDIIRRAATFQGDERFTSHAFEVLDRAAVERILTRTTLSQTQVPLGSLIYPDDQPFIVEQLTRPTRLLDVITVGKTNSNTVRFAVETARTDAAAETPYGTALPESGYGFTAATFVVKRIGHFVPSYLDVMEDAAQLETLVDARLVDGLRRRLEAQCLSGDGVGENLLGILNTSGIGTTNVGSDSNIDAAHKAITAMRLNFVEPSVIGLHPNDFEKIALAKDANGNYLYAGQEPATIWGLKPLVSPIFPQGTGLLGDYREGAMLWLRSGISVVLSSEHQDYFLRGMVAIKAETRAAFGVVRAAAFQKLSGIV